VLSSSSHCLRAVAVLIVGLAGVIPAASQGTPEDALPCNAFCQAWMGRAQPAQPAVVTPPLASTPSMNSPSAAPAKPQRKDVAKRQPAATVKNIPQRPRTTVRQDTPTVKPPVGARKQPEIVALPERQPLPSARPTPASRPIDSTASVADPDAIATAVPNPNGVSTDAQGEPISRSGYSPAVYLLVRSDVEALGFDESRPIALVRLTETQGRSALAPITLDTELVQRSAAEALANIRDGHDAGAVFTAEYIVDELMGLSLEGIRAIPLAQPAPSP